MLISKYHYFFRYYGNIQRGGFSNSLWLVSVVEVVICIPHYSDGLPQALEKVVDFACHGVTVDLVRKLIQMRHTISDSLAPALIC